MGKDPEKDRSHGPPSDPQAADAAPAGEQQRRANPVARLIGDSPFVLMSVVFHLAVLAALAFVTARTPPPVKKRIVLNVEDIELTEPLRPLRKEVDLFEHPAEAGGLAGAESETYESVKSAMERVKVRAIDVLGLESAVRTGSTEDFEPLMAKRRFRFAVSKKAEGTKGAVDQFAVMSLNAIRERHTLIVLMIDRSRSIVYQHLAAVIKRMEHYFKEIELNLSEELTKNANWVVVSFGRGYKYECEPTNDLNVVKAALGRIEIDTSGVENVGQAISAVLGRFGAHYQRVLMAVMTDEAGDDIYNPSLLESVIQQMRGANATLCVFGRESTFACRKEFVTFKLDPKVLRAADLNAIRGFEGQTMTGWADTGPESPRPQLWWVPSWYNWTAWGGNLTNLPSGFGMYGLNRMVLATGGIYFLLTVESHYDEEKLYARYAPEICSVARYGSELRENPLKSKLMSIWQQMGKAYPSCYLASGEAVANALRAAGKGQAFCLKEANALGSVLRSSPRAGSNWRRWRAHADLTLAELLRVHFLLGQYQVVLQRQWEKLRKKIPAGKRIVLHKGKAPDDYIGGPAAKREHDTAKRMIEQVIENYGDTPWEVAAKRMLEGLKPWKSAVEPLPGRGPPSLAF